MVEDTGGKAVLKNFSVNPALAGLLIFLQFLIFPAWCLADSVEVGHEFHENHLRIILDWPRPVKFTAEVDDKNLVPVILKEGEKLKETSLHGESFMKGRNLLLRFSRSLEAPQLDSLQGIVPEWIEYIQKGFDSLLFHTPGPSSFQVFSIGNRLVVQITQTASREAQSGESIDAELLHLESSLLLQTNKFEAQARLTELLRENPEDPQIMVDLAEVEERLDRWREAIDLYSCALRRKPGDKDILRSRSYLHGQYGPQIRLEQYYLDTSNEEVQRVTSVMARETFCRSYTVGVNFENRSLDDNTVRPRIDGSLGVFEGDRRRWGAFVEKAHGFAFTRLSLLGQEGEPGVSLSHRRQLPLGVLQLRGAYQEPYWDFLEGIVDQGTADRLQARWVYRGHSPFIGKYRGKNNFSGSLGFSLNRYGVDDDNDVAESVKILAEIRYHLSTLLEGLSVGYSFDAEYVDLTESRLDTTGSNFNPLPIENTQVQTWEVSLSRFVTDQLRFDLTAGYLYDNRVDSKGPLVIFDLVYDTLSNLELGIKTEFSKSSFRGTDNTFFQGGAFLTWKL
ncbi:MAG: tetratricopeptide repeat protein [Nitrospinaceae bacterium]